MSRAKGEPGGGVTLKVRSALTLLLWVGFICDGLWVFLAAWYIFPACAKTYFCGQTTIIGAPK